MEITRYEQSPLSTEDSKQLEKLEALLTKSVADGIVTREELDAIKALIDSDGKVMIQELDLVRKFIHDKVTQGKLVVDYFE